MLACSFVGWGAVRGSGRVEQETRQIRNVDSVKLTGSGKLYIELGEREELVIEAEENLLDRIESRVVNGELILGPKGTVNLRPLREINYYLTMAELEGIKITGSGNVYVPALEADELSVSILGSGDVEIERIAGRDLEVVVAGSGDIDQFVRTG